MFLLRLFSALKDTFTVFFSYHAIYAAAIRSAGVVLYGNQLCHLTWYPVASALFLMV